LAGNIIRSKRYSRAVFELALGNNEIDKWQNDLQKMAVLANDAEYSAVMQNPRFSFENKSKLLQRLLQSVGPKALNLAYILTKSGNFGLIKNIFNDYQELLDRHNNLAKADVTTAVALDENQKAKLAESLSKLTGKKVVVAIIIDPHIIGGLIARVDGKIIDGSTGSQLAALKNDLINAGR
jgi:F-type H+-transporting ATPase subunit delta